LLQFKIFDKLTLLLDSQLNTTAMEQTTLSLNFSNLLKLLAKTNNNLCMSFGLYYFNKQKNIITDWYTFFLAKLPT
jgi:hypothetical protein